MLSRKLASSLLAACAISARSDTDDYVPAVKDRSFLRSTALRGSRITVVTNIKTCGGVMQAQDVSGWMFPPPLA